jgi:hypothetical protein
VRLAYAIALSIVWSGRGATQTPAAYRAADSIVLERGVCFGTCRAYRVSINRSGDVHFVLLSGPDSGSTRQRHIDPQKFSDIVVGSAFFGHFLDLPDTIGGQYYCRYRLTDLPSVSISLFLPNRQKTVADYLGCTWAPQSLRLFEEQIDEVADTRRWLR